MNTLGGESLPEFDLGGGAGETDDDGEIDQQHDTAFNITDVSCFR